MSHQRILTTALFAAFVLASLRSGAEAPKPDALAAQIALCTAIGAGDVKAVESALGKGARLDADCPQEMSPPLLHAVNSGNVAIVTLLLDRGANVNQADNGVSATALHYAAVKGDAALVKLLTKRGAKVNAVTDEGLSPLVLAVITADKTAVVEALVEAGADVNAVDEQGDSVLDSALSKGHKQVAAYLESKGAKRGEDPGMISTLTSPDAVPEPSSGNTPVSPSSPAPAEAQLALHAALSKWNVNAVAAALKAGAQPSQPDPKSPNPFIVQAVYYGEIQNVQLLLDAGADINQPEASDGRTAIFAAILSGKPEMVNFLIKHGANVNAVADKGLTPLALALPAEGSDGVHEILQALVEAGADVNALNELGKTPLDLATERKLKLVTAFLESKGAKRGEGRPVDDLATVEMAGTNRTKDGRLVFKGFYLGMPLRDAVELFSRAGFPPTEFPEDAVGKKLEERIVVRGEDGTLIVRSQFVLLDNWRVVASPEGRVKRIMIAAKVVNTLFDSANAADPEFFGGFVQTYGLEAGFHAIEMKVRTPLRLPEQFAPDTCGAIEFVDPSGWYITLNDFRDIDYGESASRPRVKFD